MLFKQEALNGAQKVDESYGEVDIREPEKHHSAEYEKHQDNTPGLGFFQSDYDYIDQKLFLRDQMKEPKFEYEFLTGMSHSLAIPSPSQHRVTDSTSLDRRET